MHIKTITTWQQLRELREVWNPLAGGVVFRMHQWLGNWWRHYGRDGRLMTLAVYDGERLLGVAPWYVAHSAVQGHVIRQLGSGEVCTDYLAILAQPECEAQVAAALADHLSDDPALTWDLLRLEGVDPDDRATGALIEQMRQREQVVHVRPAHRCWRVALPETWEAYLAAQSKSHRKQLRRLESRVLDSDRARLHVARDGATLEVAWQNLVDLHQRRRRSLGEPGCFASQRFASFHYDVCRDMLAAGRLRLYWLEVDGRPLAAEYQLAGDGVTFAYQSGVDPDRLADEPGRLITIAAIKHAIAEGQHGFDLLRGDEPYKPHWRGEPRQTSDYRIVRNRAAARVRHAAWLTAGGVKAWIKSGVALTASDGSH